MTDAYAFGHVVGEPHRPVIRVWVTLAKPYPEAGEPRISQQIEVLPESFLLERLEFTACDYVPRSVIDAAARVLRKTAQRAMNAWKAQEENERIVSKQYKRSVENATRLENLADAMGAD